MAAAGKAYLRGENLRVFVNAETTWGTRATLAAADAVRATEFSAEVVPTSRTARDEAKESVGLQERDTEGCWMVKWSLKARLHPAAVAAEMSISNQGLHDLIRNIYGAHAAGGGADTYSLESAQTALFGLTILAGYVEGSNSPGGLDYADAADRIWSSTMLLGAVVTSMTVRGGGGKVLEVEFQGIAKSYIGATRVLVDAEAAAQTVIGLNEGASALKGSFGFDVGALVIGTGSTVSPVTPGAKFHVINSISDSADEITLDSGLENALLATDSIGPWLPGWSPPETDPLVFTSGSLKMTTLTIPITAFEHTIERPHEPEGEQAGTTEIADIFAAPTRAVRGQFTCRSRHDLGKYYVGARRRFQEFALDVVLGNSAGRHAQIEAPEIELDFAAASVPRQGVGLYTFPYTCKEVSAGVGDDEGTLKMK